MTAAKPKKITPALAAAADELGALEKEYAILLAPFEAKLPRMKALKEMLQEACPAAAEKEWTVEGKHFGVKLGPCAQERTIDFKKLVKIVGASVFATFATCTLGNLDKAVEEKVIAAVVTTAPTGPRKLSTFEKGAV
jgi:hypothetical protein